VALKRVHTSDDVVARSRLRREAAIGASLSHPNLVSIYDIAVGDEGEEVIVMEYVEGETLAAKLRRGERPSVPEALAMLDGLSAALDAIHARKIVHRDVKPGNVLIGADGSVKLADLGIAAVPDRTQITTAGSVLGTYRYMAPEQLEGAPALPAADVYGLAAVAFEALSGHKARQEPNPLALAHAIATQPPPDLREVWPKAPAAAAEVLMQGMSRDPKLRPRSAGELTARLREALEPRPKPIQLPLPSRLAVGSVPRRPRAGVVALAATLLAALAVAAIVLANTTTPRRAVASAHVTRQASNHPLASAANRKAITRTTKHRKTTHHSHQVTPTPTPAVTSSPTATPQPVASPPQPTPVSSSQAPSSPSGSPVSAVETFYHLAASHDYPAAWALADPSFRQQMEGYYGLQATMAATRAITFDGANVVNQSGTSALVSVRTTSFRTSGVQNCSGTVNLVPGGDSWLLDHINISCV
jgi:serine/threonine-protein kinase